MYKFIFLLIYGQGSTAEQRRKNGLLTIVLRKVDLQNAKLEEGEKGGTEGWKETGRKKEGRGKRISPLFHIMHKNKV